MKIILQSTTLALQRFNRDLDTLNTILKLKCSRFKSHAFADDKNCTLCPVPETSRHDFFECRHLNNLKQVMKSDLLKLGLTVISVTTLLNQPRSQEHQVGVSLFLFIQNTGYKD